MYKLEIQVSDEKSFSNFFLWDQDCKNLIGISVVELTSKMIKVILLQLYEFVSPKQHYCPITKYNFHFLILVPIMLYYFVFFSGW